MLNNWIFRHWKHNNNRANLTPITKTKHRPYWYYLIYALIPYVGLVYSYPGIIHDIFPNLPIIK
jgi:hypothetical protein